MKSQVLKVRYHSNMYNQSSTKLPVLQSWSFVSLDSYKIKLQLNFTNQLYVSSDA